MHRASHMDGDLAILLLEDNPFDAEIIEATLQERFSCLVAVVASREEFEIELEHHTPDLILSDSNLPSLSGIAALRIAQARCPQVPFIFCSGRMMPKAQEEALTSGAVACASKDDLDDLVATVEREVQKLKDPDSSS